MKPKKPQVIALTGGIGSGKSTVRKLFEAAGFISIDLDQISRAVVAQNSPGLVKIVAYFGQNILTNGELNRAELKHRIFASVTDRKALEAIVHPLIRQATLKQLAQLAEQDWVVIEIPLLAEVGKPDYVDQVVVCDCEEATQIARVQARDGMSLELVQQIIQNQASRAERLAVANWVLDTDLALPDLEMAVQSLIENLQRRVF